MRRSAVGALLPILGGAPARLPERSGSRSTASSCWLLLVGQRTVGTQALPFRRRSCCCSFLANASLTPPPSGTTPTVCLSLTTKRESTRSITMSASDGDDKKTKAPQAVTELTGPVQVGALACQMASYVKELTTTVISCTPVVSQLVEGSPKEAPEGLKPPASPTNEEAINAAEPVSPTEYDVVFHNSVLFPEGGGQPHDTGVIKHEGREIEVKRVRRMGDQCVVTTDQPLAPGQEATMILDWARRIDHMQHHTAQHLLTAVVEEVLKLPTESWSLSQPTCHIQVPTAKVDPADIQRVEERCNEAIAGGVVVNRHVFESRSHVPEARSRGIPADVGGPIRLIELPGIDSCTCCGTHVENLRELHLIKLLHQEPKGNTCRIHFVTGNRAIDMFGLLYNREKALMKEVGTSADNLLHAVQRRGKEASEKLKHSKKLLDELATFVAPQVAAEAAACTLPVFTYIREDGDIDFLTTVAQAIQASPAAEKVCVLAAGNLRTGGEGMFLVIGPKAKEYAESTVCPALQGKGGFNPKAGFRGKCVMKGWRAFVKSITKQ